MKIIIAIHLAAFFLSLEAYAHVKSVTPKQDELLVVKTALGIATIVQSPTAIQSAVIGDQSGFKVEYLDRAVTIKPLRFGAKTNLYLLTEKQRFNLRLITLSQEQADYVVYIKDPATSSTLRWKAFNKTTRASGERLSVSRIGQSAQGFILLEVLYASDETRTLKPEQFWVTQGGAPKIIDSLYLSALTVSKNAPLRVGISLSRTDLDPQKPFLVVLKGQHELSLQIPKEVHTWN